MDPGGSIVENRTSDTIEDEVKEGPKQQIKS